MHKNWGMVDGRQNRALRTTHPDGSTLNLPSYPGCSELTYMHPKAHVFAKKKNIKTCTLRESRPLLATTESWGSEKMN